MKRSWMNVFGFTIRKSGFTKGYVVTTVTVALLLLALISGGLVIADRFAGGGQEQTVTHAYVVGGDDLAIVSALAADDYAGIVYENAESIDAAAAACAGKPGAVIVLMENNDITVLTPDESAVSLETASGYAAWLAAVYPYAQQADAAPGMPPAGNDTADTGNEPEEIREIIGMLVPYAVVMLLYFLVLIYGQSVANIAIMEKTSKLMDLFLVSVRPAAMISGKVLAMAAAGLVQAVAWIFAAVGGCALGSWLVRSINPDTELAIIGVFESAAGIAAMFEPLTLIMAAFVIVAGFLVYCSLAGIGGALASKPEELSSANYLFTLALILSFFACMFSGEAAGMISDAEWMAYVPFTAVLVMPGRLITGAASVMQGVVSVGISTVCAIALMMLAGKIYAAMAFYRGKPIASVKYIAELIRGIGK